MKRTRIALLTVTLSLGTATRAADPASSDSLVWCGLDYSKVKMIGTMDFKQPGQIFPGMLDAWNGLFMREMLPELEKMAKSVKTDLAAVEASNATASDKQIEHEDGTRSEKVDASHITEADIAKLVSSYKLKEQSGLGLVFVMDRLVKAQETGCLYVVFFDVGTRKVLHSERSCSPAGGMGFRNYWFRPIKDTVKKLPRMYKQVAAQK